MANTEIQSWLRYWGAARMVNLGAILAFDQVYQARKYCQCMRVGVFAEVSDLQIWNVLSSIRGE